MDQETQTKTLACPPALQTIINEFQQAEPRERLEYLLEYAMDLPDLPPRLANQRDQMEQVHECQAAVFLHTEIDEGQVEFFLDIPRESPTVRGYAGILVAPSTIGFVADHVGFRATYAALAVLL